jgi:hypothetical protein
MKNRLRATVVTLGGLLCALVITTTTCELMAQPPKSSTAVTSSSLMGIWTLTAADNHLPDGSRVHAFGPSHPLLEPGHARCSLTSRTHTRAKTSSTISPPSQAAFSSP